MKLTIAIAAILSSFVDAANLRSSVNTVSTAGEELFNAKVSVGGLSHSLNKDNLVVLDQAIVMAYNAAYMDVDLELESATSQTSVALDDGVTTMVMAEIVGWSGGGYCDLCWDDHDDFHCYITPGCSRMVSEVDYMTSKAAMVHGKFQKLLCKKLRASGVEVFSDAKDCSLDIFENPGSFSTRLGDKVVYEAKSGHSAAFELAVKGLDTKELNSDEVKVLENIVLTTHNAALARFGYVLTEIDAATTTISGTEGMVAVVGTVVPLLKGIYAAEASDVAFAHADFEVALCHELKNSDLPAFAFVHDCKFNFVYNPVKDLALLTQA